VDKFTRDVLSSGRRCSPQTQRAGRAARNSRAVPVRCTTKTGAVSHSGCRWDLRPGIHGVGEKPRFLGAQVRRGLGFWREKKHPDDRSTMDGPRHGFALRTAKRGAHAKRASTGGRREPGDGGIGAWPPPGGRNRPPRCCHARSPRVPPNRPTADTRGHYIGRTCSLWGRRLNERRSRSPRPARRGAGRVIRRDRTRSRAESWRALGRRHHGPTCTDLALARWGVTCQIM